MQNIIFLGFTLLFFTLMFMHVYFTNAFFTQLKDKHLSIWKELGEPRWKIHFGEDSFKNAMKYIRSRGFSDLKDPLLEGFYKKIKRIEYASILLAVFILLATIIDVILGDI